VVVIGWAVAMGALLDRSYLRASANLAADLARYGSDAQWHRVYEVMMWISFAAAPLLSLATWLLAMRSGVRALQQMDRTPT
jgi:hypothetical protein